MIPEHFFWWLLTMTCVVWYCTICVYVAIKGVSDIRAMLARLRDSAGSPSTTNEMPSEIRAPNEKPQ